MNVLNLEVDDVISIDKKEFKVINKVKFSEKSSYWYEYMLYDFEKSEAYYLNVELNQLCILYKVQIGEKCDINITVEFNDKRYNLKESGREKVVEYWGITDVGLDWTAKYYEYCSEYNENEILSIEVWDDEQEVSIGNVVNKNKIKFVRKER